MQIMISVWQMLETKSFYDISYLFNFNLVFRDNLTQKFIQGKNLDPKIYYKL